MSKKIIKLSTQLDSEPEKSDESEELKSEIEKLDKQIDQMVYKLYGLTEEEIKVVEN